MGIHALGSTPYNKSGYPGSEYFAWLGQAQYTYRVSNGCSQLLLRGNVQLSNAALLPLEKIAIGGVGTVRGYRENYRVRDEGYNVSLKQTCPRLKILAPFIHSRNTQSTAIAPLYAPYRVDIVGCADEGGASSTIDGLRKLSPSYGLRISTGRRS